MVGGSVEDRYRIEVREKSCAPPEYRLGLRKESKQSQNRGSGTIFSTFGSIWWNPLWKSWLNGSLGLWDTELKGALGRVAQPIEQLHRRVTIHSQRQRYRQLSNPREADPGNTTPVAVPRKRLRRAGRENSEQRLQPPKPPKVRRSRFLSPTPWDDAVNPGLGVKCGRGCDRSSPLAGSSRPS